MCNGNIRGKGVSNNTRQQAKCHFVHHFTKYLNIGPFKMEVQLYEPFRSIIIDIIYEKEIDWIMDFSKPKLLAGRIMQSREKTILETTNELSKTMPKGLQPAVVRFNDIIFNEREVYKQISPTGEPLDYDISPLKDPYGYQIVHPTMAIISKRIELVTNFNVTSRNGASWYQSTNYGLSGMAAMHIDPWGYEQGVPIRKEQKSLVHTGDYIATFMGWIKDTASGGGTSFMDKHFEGRVMPRKGSAAFWINLLSCHSKDYRTWHAGCPVLKGSKWVLNKWIYSFDQWIRWPCLLERGKTIPYFVGISS